jgi:transposase-like protein
MDVEMWKPIKNSNLSGWCSKGPGSLSLAGDLMTSISPSFIDQRAATRWLVQKLNPNGPACPHCAHQIEIPRLRETWAALGRVKCTRCKRSFSAATGTPLSGSKVPPASIVLLALLMAAGLNDRDIASRAGLDRSTVNRWRPLLMERDLKRDNQQGEAHEETS